MQATPVPLPQARGSPAGHKPRGREILPNKLALSGTPQAQDTATWTPSLTPSANLCFRSQLSVTSSRKPSPLCSICSGSPPHGQMAVHLISVSHTGMGRTGWKALPTTEAILKPSFSHKSLLTGLSSCPSLPNPHPLQPDSFLTHPSALSAPRHSRAPGASGPESKLPV